MLDIRSVAEPEMLDKDSGALDLSYPAFGFASWGAKAVVSYGLPSEASVDTVLLPGSLEVWVGTQRQCAAYSASGMVHVDDEALKLLSLEGHHQHRRHRHHHQRPPWLENRLALYVRARFHTAAS